MVTALIQALPDAAACDKFLSWKGQPPPPQPLVRGAGGWMWPHQRGWLLQGNWTAHLRQASAQYCSHSAHAPLLPCAAALLQAPEMQLARRALLARLQRLPVTVTPQPIERPIVSACDSCGQEVEADGDWLVECDMCRWARAWGVGVQPDWRQWLRVHAAAFAACTTHVLCRVLCVVTQGDGAHGLLWPGRVPKRGQLAV